MSSRQRGLVLLATMCAAAALLSGCSSSGTVGAGGGAGHAGGSGSSGGGGNGADPGCVEAAAAIQNAAQYQNSNDPAAALKGIRTSITQLREAADKTRKPGAKEAMNKEADDLQNILSQAQKGKKPDTSTALTDAQAIAVICGG